MSVALVTGAAAGIGRATAVALAAAGHRVFATDRDEAGLRGLAAELPITYAVGDLADPAIPGRLVAECARTMGRIDVVALVAGIGQSGPATTIDVDLWDRVHAINLRAPFLLARDAFPHLEATGGCIVAVASLAGTRGWPYAAAYSAAKGGLVNLMRTLALEYGVHGVRVNVVAPGSVATDLAVGMRTVEFTKHEALERRPGGVDGRVGTADEIAATIAFLASPAASYINGAVLPVDGGASA
jgi:meso-butanediol dehydrogenase/(S,S)-butanediol dehydrogenase/diacetyl reductase